MKIGILQADSVREELQPEFGDYPGMFEAIFLQQDAQLSFRHYNVEKMQYPAVIDEVDAYLITGSRFSVYEDHAWIHRLGGFVRQLHAVKKPLIGICFGHQLIAQALGGKTEKASQGWNVGVHRFDWLQQQTEASQHFKLVVSHQDQVTQLPADAQLLAGSDFCPVGAYQIDDHILCFQGHPEFPLDYSAALMDLRLEILGQDLVQRGKQSLLLGDDSALSVRCMLQFIQPPAK